MSIAKSSRYVGHSLRIEPFRYASVSKLARQAVEETRTFLDLIESSGVMSKDNALLAIERSAQAQYLD